MLQATKNKYTVETLKPLNTLYDHEHWLTQQDVDMANSYVELIERTRSEKTPQIGDRLIYVDRYGKHYGNALIEKREDPNGLISICEEPPTRTAIPERFFPTRTAIPERFFGLKITIGNFLSRKPEARTRRYSPSELSSPGDLSSEAGLMMPFHREMGKIHFQPQKTAMNLRR